MTAAYRNRLVTTISNAPGTSGAFTISTAQSGYTTFAAGDDGLTFDVVAVDGTAWEVRTGCVYTNTGTSLARGTLESSSTGSAISLSSATVLTVTPTAAKFAALENQLNRGFTFIESDSSETQTFNGVALTKITAMSKVVTNPYSWWDTTNKKFVPNRAGYYQILTGCQLNLSSIAVAMQGVVYLNGVVDTYGAEFYQTSGGLPTVATVVNMNGSTDYVESYIYVSPTTTSLAGIGRIFFKAIYLGT